MRADAMARTSALSDDALRMLLDHYVSVPREDRDFRYMVGSQAALSVAAKRGI
jgi:hypothetical protein